ncbi:hypothetical protein RCC89_18540 [Cytophagaceae bacterium ABcell3]|nr:hypothetical protein RCC89_18540 [Cytophagaceae bacterium ABcell3]
MVLASLIPVGQHEMNVQAYEDAMNNTYAPLGITYSVTLDESFRNNKDWDLNGDGRVQASGTRNFSVEYKGEEAEMIFSYVESKGGEDEMDPETAYILAVNEVSNIEDDQLGKMPPTQQFGFIYTANVREEALARTVAHEIGHGAYHLEHTFLRIYLGKNSEGATDNLMDYGSGIDLWKLQWDIVHDPGHVWGILRRDRDHEAYLVDWIQIDRANSNFVNGMQFDNPVAYGLRNENISIKYKITNSELDKALKNIKSYNMPDLESDYVVSLLVYNSNNFEILDYSITGLVERNPVSWTGFIYPIKNDFSYNERVIAANRTSNNSCDFALGVFPTTYQANDEIRWQSLRFGGRPETSLLSNETLNINSRFLGLINEIPELWFGFEFEQLALRRPNLRHGVYSKRNRNPYPNFPNLLKYYDIDDAVSYNHYLRYLNEEPVNPINYLNKYLVDAGTWTFLGRKPDFSINIYLYYLLKKAEAEIKLDPPTYLDLSNSIRFAAPPSSHANHNLGLAIDINPVKNPMFQIVELHYLVWLLTNDHLFNYNTTGGNAINHMKSIHNNFIMKCDELANIEGIERSAQSANNIPLLNEKVSLRMDLMKDLDSYFNCNDCISILDLQEGELNVLIENIVDEVVDYQMLRPKDDIVQFINVKLSELNDLEEKIDGFKDYFNAKVKLALFLDVTHEYDCNVLNEYLNSLLMAIALIKDDLSEYSVNIYNNDDLFESNVYLVRLENTLDVFNKIQSSILVKNEISNSKSFESVGKRIIEGINSDEATGGKLLKYGFFELNTSFVEKMMESGHMSWGGYFPRQKDWMHFEVREDSKTFGASQPESARLIYEMYPLPKLKNELENLGIVVEWDSEEEYLIIIND